MAGKTKAIKSDSAGAMWAIASAHAYNVRPQRNLTSEFAPAGGSLPLDEPLRVVIGTALKGINEKKFTPIVLEHNESRGSLVRERIIQYVFGDDEKINIASVEFASSLAAAMDERSLPRSLLLLVSEKHLNDEAQRRISFLLFPEDKAIQFEPVGNDASVPVLKACTNIFSTASNLRKVARFDGKNLKTGFLSGSVSEYKAGSVAKSTADFWIKGFLGAKLGLNGSYGTQLLARGLQAAVAATPSGEKEHVMAAVMLALTAPTTNWSLNDFATKYLPISAHAAFLKVAPNEETKGALFEVDKVTLQKKLAFRIFELPGGVFVTAPIEQVGTRSEHKVVTIDDSQAYRFLSCSGKVIDEKVTATRPRSS